MVRLTTYIYVAILYTIAMPAIAIHGTTSNAGKTIIATALCRIFADKGYSVAPFKAQNMSLNSYVTKDCGEIARAQALQAHAARIEPTAEMNPILLKPKAEHISQVVVYGRPYADMNVGEYHDFVEKRAPDSQNLSRTSVIGI